MQRLDQNGQGTELARPRRTKSACSARSWRIASVRSAKCGIVRRLARRKIGKSIRRRAGSSTRTATRKRRAEAKRQRSDRVIVSAEVRHPFELSCQKLCERLNVTRIYPEENITFEYVFSFFSFLLHFSSVFHFRLQTYLRHGSISCRKHGSATNISGVSRGTSLDTPQSFFADP